MFEEAKDETSNRPKGPRGPKGDRAESSPKDQGGPRIGPIGEIAAWSVSFAGFGLTAVGAYNQWLQQVSLLALLWFAALLLFSAVFVRVQLTRAWTARRSFSSNGSSQLTTTLIVLATANAAGIALVVRTDPPELGSWSFVFAGIWLMLAAYALAFAAERSSHQRRKARRRAIVLRGGLSFMGLVAIAVAGGDVGLLLREVDRGTASTGVFFAFQTLFIATAGFLLLLGRRRGVGFGFIALGAALSGTAIDALLSRDAAFGASFIVTSCAIAGVGIFVLTKKSPLLALCLFLAGAALIGLGVSARDNGILPFWVLYVLAGSAVFVVGCVLLVNPRTISWNPPLPITRLVFALSSIASLLVALAAGILALHFLREGTPGPALSYLGFAIGASVLIAGAFVARARTPRRGPGAQPPKSESSSAK